MPDTVQHVQGRHVWRCSIVATGNLLTLVVAALNAQRAGRGDTLKPWLFGWRVVTASAGWTISNPDGTGTVTYATTLLPYDCPATDLEDNLLAGGATLGIEVYTTGDPTLP